MPALKVIKFRRVRATLTAISWCLSLSWDASKLYTVLRILSEVIRPILAITVAFIGRNVMNLLAGQMEAAHPTELLLFLLIGLFLIGTVRSGIQKASQYCQSMHEELLRARVSMILMEYGFSADLEYFDNPDYHDKLQSANQDSYSFIYVVWNALACISAMVSFLSVFLVLSQANVFYGIIISIAAVPASFISAKYTKLLYGLSLEQINSSRKMSYCQSLATNRIYAQDLHLFGAGDMLKDRYLRIWEVLFRTKRSVMRKRTWVTGFLELLPEMAVTWIGIDIAMKVLAENSTIGDYSLYTGLIGQILVAITMLSSSVMNIYDNKMRMENFKSLETYQNRVVETGDRKLEGVDAIEFLDVSFTYPGVKKAALSHVNLYLQKNQKVALVGLNGSGKSTFIKLILRFYNPDSGIIKINGVNVQDYSLDSLRSSFSAYFQDMHNFSFSLRENFVISEGGQWESGVDKDMEAIILKTDGSDILDKASKRLDTEVTRFFEPDGIELSGGQHQKLALARSLYRTHTALILDEPSSSLDPKAEHDIFELLKEYTDGKMTIFTSHRLSNVFLADRIIVLEHGQVIEDGTQQELLKNKHRYAELYRYQQERFEKS